MSHAFEPGEYVGVKVSKKAGATHVSARQETKTEKGVDKDGKYILISTPLEGSIRCRDLKSGAEFVIDIRTFERKYKKA